MTVNVAGRQVSIATLATVFTLITTIIGAWLFMDVRFAHAEDLEQLKQKVTIQGWTTEQGQIDLRADVIEERVFREEQKASPNTSQIARWKKQLAKIEKRAVWLQQLQDAIAAKVKVETPNPDD